MCSSFKNEMYLLKSNGYYVFMDSGVVWPDLVMLEICMVYEGCILVV
jgi:hypothetical protein